MSWCWCVTEKVWAREGLGLGSLALICSNFKGLTGVVKEVHVPWSQQQRYRDPGKEVPINLNIKAFQVFVWGRKNSCEVIYPVFSSRLLLCSHSQEWYWETNLHLVISDWLRFEYLLAWDSTANILWGSYFSLEDTHQQCRTYSQIFFFCRFSTTSSSEQSNVQAWLRRRVPRASGEGNRAQGR